MNHECKSIAFPLISAGIYGYPKDQALLAAVNSIEALAEQNRIDVTIVIFEQECFELAKSLFPMLIL